MFEVEATFQFEKTKPVEKERERRRFKHITRGNTAKYL